MVSDVYRARLQDEAWMRALVESIWNVGFAVLPDFLEPAALAELTEYASQEMARNARVSAPEGSVGYRLGRDEVFFGLFQKVYDLRCEREGIPTKTLNPDRQHVGFPYKDARDGKHTVETDYHYDASYVNTTFTIKMPAVGGELIAFPNIRKNPRNFFVRVFSRILRHSKFMRDITPHIVVRSKPNDLCVFFGDRTFHGVEPIAEGERLLMTINNHW